MQFVHGKKNSNTLRVIFPKSSTKCRKEKGFDGLREVRKLKTAGKVLRFLKKFMRRKNERVQNCRKSVKC